MWSNVTSKFEGHTSLQTNAQTNGGQTQSSGSIKGNINSWSSNQIYNFNWYRSLAQPARLHICI